MRTETWSRKIFRASAVASNSVLSVRALIQRVSQAAVTVDDEVVGRIGRGFLVLLGVTHADGPRRGRVAGAQDCRACACSTMPRAR